MADSKIEAKLDKVLEQQSDMNITLAKQSVILEEHVKRSTMLEDLVTPLKTDMDRAKGGIALVGLLALLASIYMVFK